MTTTLTRIASPEGPGSHGMGLIGLTRGRLGLAAIPNTAITPQSETTQDRDEKKATECHRSTDSMHIANSRGWCCGCRIGCGEGLAEEHELPQSHREKMLRKYCEAMAKLQGEDGATTAEYAVVLVAATSFAAVLMGILKSDAVREALTSLITRALSVA
ncbi:uncharacterized protein DUF4244 [Pseudoscardovia suis]|uniref:DUF4244 domain-containing protein n=3 Tax=Pseudoscardovia suis TaxID=987063 RepID=A0A261EV51_9BIFI|nr:hypothetical protein PSSU_1180 [Pseudoscardovia suis]PJJ62731.1 uncharacterized protein DUF4244 [Pseudoscardovia suis]